MTNQKLNIEAIAGIREIDDAEAANCNGGMGDINPSMGPSSEDLDLQQFQGTDGPARPAEDFGVGGADFSDFPDFP